jgi:hypothetical protein
MEPERIEDVSQSILEDAMEVLAAAALEDGDHPSPGEILAYHAGEIAQAADRTGLQQHLAWCSDCAHTLVDLASWPEIELRNPALQRTVAEEAADWQAIRRRLAPGNARGGGPEGAPDSFASPHQAGRMPPVPSRPYRPSHLLAAALLLAVAGLSIQVARLSRRPAPARTSPAPIETPQANVFVVDLAPAGTSGTRAAERGRPDTPRTAVPGGIGTVVFLLVQDHLRQFADYAVELRGDDGRVFWQTAGLVRLPEGGFSVAVPLTSILSRAVEIRLYGVDGRGRELLSIYRTRVERSASN